MLARFHIKTTSVLPSLLQCELRNWNLFARGRADNDLWAILRVSWCAFLLQWKNVFYITVIWPGGSTFFYRRAHILITIACPGDFQQQTHRLLHPANESLHRAESRRWNLSSPSLQKAMGEEISMARKDEHRDWNGNGEERFFTFWPSHTLQISLKKRVFEPLTLFYAVFLIDLHNVAILTENFYRIFHFST